VSEAFLLHSRPVDATLTVTRAAHVLGVHPNTVRAWSDAGRLRYYRINPRGDRRYRLGDLQRFLAASAGNGRDPSGPGDHPADPQPWRPGAGRADRRRARQPQAPSIELEATSAAAAGRSPIVEIIEALAGLTATAIRDTLTDDAAPFRAAVKVIREATAAPLAAIWRAEGEMLVPVAAAGLSRDRLADVPRGFGVLGAALDQATAAGRPVVVDPEPGAFLPAAPEQGREVACTIPGIAAPWGVLLLATRGAVPLDEADRELVAAAATALGNVAQATVAAIEVNRRRHRSEALRRVGSDIASRLDLEQTLGGVVEHATVLLGGDRAAVYLFQADGTARTVASRGLSPAFQAAVHDVRASAGPSLAHDAVAARRPLFSVHYADDPRVGELRAAVVQEGFDTACVAPLLDGDEPDALGVLGVYHDRPHSWTDDDLETIGALASQAAAAIKTARTYQQLATWAAQLQSIQQLGARLNRLSSVAEIGQAIATELRQLIDYHNVRVYRLFDEDLVPVAMQGQVGEYVDETPEQLRVKLGQGITGWVAEHRVPQLLDDASADERAFTIPGTDDDLDESMLLAPMVFEDQVLGVLVLSKLGLRQFQPGDLRLLVIYASFAAQAMANADATGRLREQSAALEQKVRSQRELLRLTESILMTYDPAVLLETTADRLLDLVAADNLAIDLVTGTAGELAVRVARGAYADVARRPRSLDEVGLHDRVACIPLPGRDGPIGMIEMERLGDGRAFSEDEFELVQLFAAQVSIGLQNAEAHQAVEHRAQTDVLTGLLNHGTFVERMNRLISAGEPFSLVMLDLDRFKGVNDGFGHQAGDRLLRQVAASIVRASRDSDAVFRYGGDEFCVLLPGSTALEVGAIAERMRSAVASTVGPGSGWRGRARALEASAGTSSFPTDGSTADEVLLAADRACFVAKRSGGGRVATAAEGQAIAGELTLQTPTPIDPLAASLA
jgi:diguanylate cyclase (GGDEF)-like protein/excisionase family DNA binding protein